MTKGEGKTWRVIGPLSWVVVAVAAIACAVSLVHRPSLDPMPEIGEGAAPPPPPHILERHASLLAPAPDDVQPRPSAPPVGEVFRLVTISLDMAFIEERQTKRQKGYRAGDALGDGCSISEVRADCVIVSTPSGDETLRFDWAGGGDGGQDGGAGTPGDPAGSANAFFRRMGGSRKGTNQWFFAREAVLEYVDELKARPERLVAVFDSLAPVYAEGGSITGYKLDVKGEKDFFDAAGLAQGDIVRKVNYIPMTNRMAAESLIRRFTTDGDFDFIVIEIERDGATMQQIYHVR